MITHLRQHKTGRPACRVAVGHGHRAALDPALVDCPACLERMARTRQI